MDRFLQDKLSETPDAPPKPRTTPPPSDNHAPGNAAPTPSVTIGGVGRARRLEYIPIAVFCYLVNTCCIGLVLEVYAILAVLVVFRVVMIVENARRLHDVGYSGWWQLVPGYMLIVAFYRGQVGANKYGPNPRKREGAYAAKARNHRRWVVVVFALVPLLALYKARHDSGRPYMFKDESKATRWQEFVDDEFGEIVPVDGNKMQPQASPEDPFAGVTEEELERVANGESPESVEAGRAAQTNAGNAQPQTEPEDPDAELKRKFAYVAERGDREDERRKAQNAVNWLASNKSSSLDDGGEEMRGYAERFYIGTKERTNDFTKEERRQRYATRFEQAKNLSDMAQFVIDENGDKEQYAEETRKARNMLSFLSNHPDKFDALGDYDVAELTRRVGKMYDAAAERRMRRGRTP